VNTASETFIVYVILYRLEHGRQFYVHIWGMSRFVFFLLSWSLTARNMWKWCMPTNAFCAHSYDVGFMKSGSGATFYRTIPPLLVDIISSIIWWKTPCHVPLPNYWGTCLHRAMGI